MVMDENSRMETAISIAYLSVDTRLKVHPEGVARTVEEKDQAEAYGVLRWLAERSHDPSWHQFLHEALDEVIAFEIA